MIQNVNIYLRDGKEMDRVQWYHCLHQDMEAENTSSWRITANDVEEQADVMAADNEEPCINGHTYAHQAYMAHDNVHELMQTLTEYEYYDEIFEAVKKMPDEIIHRIVLAIDGPKAVAYQDGRYCV